MLMKRYDSEKTCWAGFIAACKAKGASTMIEKGEVLLYRFKGIGSLKGEKTSLVEETSQAMGRVKFKFRLGRWM